MKAAVWDLSGVRLWLARTGEVDGPEWQALYARMPPRRQARCDRYRRQEDRRLCILADALARHALAWDTGADPEAVAFDREAGGKPYAVGLDRHFSLSHSGSLALCATAAFPLGLDVQRQRPVSETMTRRMARWGYEGASEEAFFAWWVRQEAAGKLSGEGLCPRPLPEGLRFWPGELEEADGRYFYCVCAQGGTFLSEKPVI